MTGGAYLLKSALQKVYGQGKVEAFVLGGTQPGTLHAEGLSVYHPAYFNVFDYYPNHALSSYFMDTTLDILHDTSPSPSGLKLIDASNLVSYKAEDPVLVSSYKCPIPAGKWYVVGCILQAVGFPPAADEEDDEDEDDTTTQAPSMLGGEVSYEVSHPSYAAVKGHLFWNPNTEKWDTRLTEAVYGTFSTFELLISNTENTKTINGRDYLYWLIYAGSPSGGSDISSRIFFNIRPVDRTTRVYLYRLHNRTNYVEITSRPSNYTSLLE